MAQQNVYKFSLFDNLDYGTSAPKLDPVYEPERAPKKKTAKKVAPAKKKAKQKLVSKEELAATQASFVSTVKVVAVITAVFALFAMAMFFNGKLDEIATDISKVESDIKIAQSENVRLTSALEGMVSIDKVEDYAENTLGMVKLENYKITYFEPEDSNHVIVSGGKTYKRQNDTDKIISSTE